MTDPEPISSF